MKKTKKYKIKTKKAAAKRFDVNSKGKVRRSKSGKKHLNEHMSGKEIRQKGQKVGVSKSDIDKIRQMLPGVKIKE